MHLRTLAGSPGRAKVHRRTADALEQLIWPIPFIRGHEMRSLHLAERQQLKRLCYASGLLEFRHAAVEVAARHQGLLFPDSWSIV